MRFLHYEITMTAFQAEGLRCTIVQFRKFIYKSKLKICINTKNVISAPDNETEKRPRGNQNQLPCLLTKYTNFSSNKPKNTVKDNF